MNAGPGRPSGGGGRNRRRRGRRPPNRGGHGSGRDRNQNGEEKPSLIIFDLNNANAKPLALIPKLKSKLKKGTSIIGFLSHVQGDLKQKAHEVGCDMVLPRSAFSQNLPQLLRRHGAPEEENAIQS